MPKKAAKTKKKKDTTLWEWKDDEGQWREFADEDKELLETRYQANHNDVFCTTDFSFNKEYSVVYEINYVHMTQINQETSVGRAIRREGVTLPSPATTPVKKKAKLKSDTSSSATVWFWMDDEDTWQEFADVDTSMLETSYWQGGPKSTFMTRDFSFNKTHQTLYEINFSSMVQRNTLSGKARSLRRGNPTNSPIKAGATKGGTLFLWEWWSSENATWNAYEDKDKMLLETAFLASSKVFLTKDLTFNKEYDSQYMFDFLVMTQMNCESGTSRKIRRRVKGSSSWGIAGDTSAAGEDADDGYASALAGGFALGGGKTTGLSTSSGSTTSSFEFTPCLSPSFIKTQKKHGAQSRRGGQSAGFGPAVKSDKHGSKCFQEMLENEKNFAGEWVVFYHSYSSAALLYEVQAAVAAVLFRFKSKFATLPRLLYKPFEHIPNAARMLEEFPTWTDRDHDPAFRGVGICGTSSLLAPDPEAPPKSVFLMGYSVGPLHGLLERLLEACGIPKSLVKSLAKTIVALANKHGLDAKSYGGKPCKSGRSGHMLQIFMRRELCDEFVYPSMPFGVPDKERDQPLSQYLAKDTKIQGQIRITANPDVFIRAVCVRMFVFSADPNFHANRHAFQEELTGALDPVLGDEATRTKAALGIFGGKLPSWWTSEDQGDAAAMPLTRYAAPSL